MDDEAANYDEFGMLKQYADHEGIPWSGRPEVVRRFFDVGSGRRLSALVWGRGDPEVVLLHGSGQNAHTWDSVAMALNVPLLAIDLPGHGHSDWRDDHDYGAWPNADAVAAVLAEVASDAKVVVGMSLGGMTNIRLAAKYPELVRRAVIVDITPAAGPRRAPLTPAERGATVLRDGPAVFGSFEEILGSVAAALPNRPVDSLRPGVLHNARRLDDGRWTWRYDFARAEGGGTPQDRGLLWDDVAAIRAPIMLVRGERSALVRDEDLAELLRHQPETRVELVAGAGHSVQSDKPVYLAGLIEDFVSSTP
jgi:pimeloyl-ACP methyl ester carboxylesterase